MESRLEEDCVSSVSHRKGQLTVLSKRSLRQLVCLLLWRWVSLLVYPFSKGERPRVELRVKSATRSTLRCLDRMVFLSKTEP